MDPRRDRRRQSDYSLLPPFIFIFNTTSPRFIPPSVLRPRRVAMVTRDPGEKAEGQLRDGRAARGRVCFAFWTSVLKARLHPLGGKELKAELEERTNAPRVNPVVSLDRSSFWLCSKHLCSPEKWPGFTPVRQNSQYHSGKMTAVIQGVET